MVRIGSIVMALLLITSAAHAERGSRRTGRPQVQNRVTGNVHGPQKASGFRGLLAKFRRSKSASRPATGESSSFRNADGSVTHADFAAGILTTTSVLPDGSTRIRKVSFPGASSTQDLADTRKMPVVTLHRVTNGGAADQASAGRGRGGVQPVRHQGVFNIGRMTAEQINLSSGDSGGVNLGRVVNRGGVQVVGDRVDIRFGGDTGPVNHLAHVNRGGNQAVGSGRVYRDRGNSSGDDSSVNLGKAVNNGGVQLVGDGVDIRIRSVTGPVIHGTHVNGPGQDQVVGNGRIYRDRGNGR